MQPVFRFAPSPNGFLHLGHTYSALLNNHLARQAGGRFLLRMEDIDTIRCRPEFVDAALEDLAWLGLRWEEPVLHQSRNFERYRAALQDFRAKGLVYPCFCSRSDLLRNVRQCRDSGHVPWPSDPDGVPHYAGTCRGLSFEETERRKTSGLSYALRLDMAKARGAIGTKPLFWVEAGRGEVPARPEKWGEVVLARKETPTSYHLSVVLDDALQGVSDVVRGEDLFEATAIHRLLQELLGLPRPRYHHHPLLRDDIGQKLAKSLSSTPLRQLRASGVLPQEIRNRFGFA